MIKKKHFLTIPGLARKPNLSHRFVLCYGESVLSSIALLAMSVACE